GDAAELAADPAPDVGHAFGLAQIFGGRPHHLQVASGAETRVAAGQHHAADIAVDDESLQRATQLAHQRPRQDVEPVGFVEGHHGPVAATVDMYPPRRVRVVTFGDQS